jgi:glyoxylase-like metal-dependent hydrolase (beta-lactamase superfamily II)
LHAINVGQADIPNNTIVHIPSLDAVITGDVIYNGINPFLAASGPDGWRSWIASIAKVADSNPASSAPGTNDPNSLTTT